MKNQRSQIIYTLDKLSTKLYGLRRLLTCQEHNVSRCGKIRNEWGLWIKGWNVLVGRIKTGLVKQYMYLSLKVSKKMFTALGASIKIKEIIGRYCND